MKNIYFVLFLLLFLASCTKESNLIDKDQDVQVSTRTQLTPEQVVAAFSPVVNGNYVPNRTYTGQEAIRGVETVLNYDYGDFRNKFDETYSHKEEFIISKSNGLITDQVISAIYDEAEQKMACHYNSINKSVKMQLFTDLELLSESSTQLKISLYNVVGSASGSVNNFPNIRWVFNPGDEWNAYIGTCLDPNYPSGGPDEVEKRVNFNLVGNGSISLGEWYSDFSYKDYVNDDFWHVLNPNDPIPGDCIVDKNMWYVYSSCSSSTWCLDHNGLNFYLGNAEYNALRYEAILNKKFINIEIDFSLIPGPNSVDYFWDGEGRYGKRNVDENRVPKQVPDCE